MKAKHLLTACLLLIVMVRPAHAGEPTERVRTLLEEAISIRTGEGTREEKRVAVMKAIDTGFDFDRMAERALGGYWSHLSPEERVEFQGLFRELFQDSYSFMVLENLGQEKIRYQDENVRGDAATVETVMVRRNATLSVDYDLANVAGKWLIQDVRIDGVSILKNYQASFTNVIRRDSFEKLIEKMRAKKREIEKSP